MLINQKLPSGSEDKILQTLQHISVKSKQIILVQLNV